MVCYTEYSNSETYYYLMRCANIQIHEALHSYVCTIWYKTFLIEIKTLSKKNNTKDYSTPFPNPKHTQKSHIHIQTTPVCTSLENNIFLQLLYIFQWVYFIFFLYTYIQVEYICLYKFFYYCVEKIEAEVLWKLTFECLSYDNSLYQ